MSLILGIGSHHPGLPDVLFVGVQLLLRGNSFLVDPVDVLLYFSYAAAMDVHALHHVIELPHDRMIGHVLTEEDGPTPYEPYGGGGGGCP